MKKYFYETYNVGKAKYLVMFHDGIKRHPDNSLLEDIHIFKNKIKRNEFIKELIANGYEWKY